MIDCFEREYLPLPNDDGVRNVLQTSKQREFPKMLGWMKCSKQK